MTCSRLALISHQRRTHSCPLRNWRKTPSRKKQFSQELCPLALPSDFRDTVVSIKLPRPNHAATVKAWSSCQTIVTRQKEGGGGCERMKTQGGVERQNCLLYDANVYTNKYRELSRSPSPKKVKTNQSILSCMECIVIKKPSLLTYTSICGRQQLLRFQN